MDHLIEADISASFEVVSLSTSSYIIQLYIAVVKHFTVIFSRIGENMKTIEKIELIMKEKGISRYQIEKSLGIKQSTFKNWVNGTEPGVEKIITILKYLEVSADEIFEIDSKQTLNAHEKELLSYFRQLPEPEQLRELGRLEARAEMFKGKLSESKIG